MEIDYELVQTGIKITDTHFTMKIDGTFSPLLSDEDAEKHEFVYHEYMSPVPLYRDDRGEAQIMISDYTINSLVKSSIDLNWLESTQTLNGDAIGKYIHGFDESFGSFTNIEMTCMPVKGTQKLEVNELTKF